MSIKNLKHMMKQNPHARIAHIVRNDILCALYLIKANENEGAINRLRDTIDSLQGVIDDEINRGVVPAAID